MIIELMLEFHAWSTCRPVKESDRTADILEKEINKIMETELEQGRSSESTSSACFIGRPMSLSSAWESSAMSLCIYADFGQHLKRKLVNDWANSSTASRWPSLLSQAYSYCIALHALLLYSSVVSSGNCREFESSKRAVSCLYTIVALWM